MLLKCLQLVSDQAAARALAVHQHETAVSAAKAAHEAAVVAAKELYRQQQVEVERVYKQDLAAAQQQHDMLVQQVSLCIVELMVVAHRHTSGYLHEAKSSLWLCTACQSSVSSTACEASLCTATLCSSIGRLQSMPCCSQLVASTHQCTPVDPTITNVVKHVAFICRSCRSGNRTGSLERPIQLHLMPTEPLH